MSALVYSTSCGSMCPACGQPLKSCVCRAMKRAAVPVTDGKVRMRFETSGRKGKGVTLIAGLSLSEEGLLQLARQLKGRLGVGGSVKEGEIELQGDQRAKVLPMLRAQGFKI